MAMWQKDRNYGYGGSFRPGFSTPPASWNSSTRHYPPMLPRSERKPTSFDRSFHVVHKLPAFDSPYARAKHVQVVEKDPFRAISMFWAALNAGDRVDSALKDMASLMKQVNRSDEAIEAIKSFRYICSVESQNSLDNILLELYKRCGRMEEYIDLLQLKIKRIEGLLLGGRRVKISRSNGRKCQVTIEHEYSRLLGNLAWVYLQHDKYPLAEELYRKALLVEQDKNKQCNLAICLMYMHKMTEAKFLLKCVRSSANGLIEETHAKSYKRASQILAEIESHSCEETLRPFSLFIGRDTEENVSEDQNSGFVVSRKLADGEHPETSEMDEPKRVLCSWNDSIISGSDIESSESASLRPGISLKTSFVGRLNREGSYVENYKERTGDNLEMVPGHGTGYDGYMIGYASPNPVGGSPRVPFTQPKKGSYYSFDDAAGKCSRKLSFSGIEVQGSNSGIGQASGVVECAGERKNSQEFQSQCKPIIENKEVGKYFSSDSSNKGWVTMGAEENAQLPKNKNENTNHGVFFKCPVLLNQTEHISQKMGSLVLEDGYVSQASNANTSTNVEVWHPGQEGERNGQVWQFPWMFENMK